jgi:hypothetical protein
MSLYLWLFVVPLALLFVAALMQPALSRRRNTLIATTGRGAIGHVLAVGRDDDALGGSSHWVQVQYDYDGQPVTVKVQISWRDKARYRVGQRVGLTYAPSRSQIVRLDPPEWAVPKSS